MTGARRTVVAGMGVIAGLAGVEHGIGEVLQGWAPPPAVVFESWPDAPFFDILSGEPAMSLVPNLLLSGVLTIAVSAAFMLVAIRYGGHRKAGFALLGLSAVWLLVGGGFGPPLLGVILGLAALGADSPSAWWRRHQGIRGLAAAVWPGAFIGCVLAWLALMPGVQIADWFLEIDALVVVPTAFLLAMSLLVTSIITGFAYDARDLGT